MEVKQLINCDTDSRSPPPCAVPHSDWAVRMYPAIIPQFLWRKKTPVYKISANANMFIHHVEFS